MSMPSDQYPGQYPGGPYGAPGPYGGGMPPAVGTNGKAKAAMILGICGFCGICAILGIIFGFIAKNEIKKTGQTGDGMALAGIICGIAWLVLSIILYAAR